MALTIQQQLELLHVEAYDLATFLQGVEQGIKDGYSISLQHNETYPYGTIGHYIVKMVKQELQEVKTVVETTTEEVKTLQEASESTQEGVSSQEVQKEVVEAPKRGRKAKSE